MQSEPRARFVTVYEASIGSEARETTGGCRAFGELRKESGHGRPGLGGFRIDFGIAITFAIGDPAYLAAVCDADGHAKAARREHVPEGRSACHFCDLREELWRLGNREPVE